VFNTTLACVSLASVRLSSSISFCATALAAHYMVVTDRQTDRHMTVTSIISLMLSEMLATIIKYCANNVYIAMIVFTER